MKAHPEIDNPWALAWWMSDQGDTSHKEADPGLNLIAKWEQFEQSPEYQAYCAKYPMTEANSASSMGQLTRPGKPVESKRGSLRLGLRLLEAEGGIKEGTREVPVLIIKEGMGNKADRHFYSAELLNRVAPLFDGIKAYANHPSKTEETDRPERDVKEIVGYYHSPRVVMVEGRAAIAATLKIIDGAAYEWAWNLVKESAAFAKKFKDKDLVGISINAWGASHEVEGADGAVNMVDDLTEVQSADIVTQAGAGGGFRLREAIKKVLAREESKPGRGNMNELMAKHGEGLKALHDKIKSNPQHAEAYGPAMEELMSHHAALSKAHEEEAAKVAPAAGADSADADGVEEKKEAAKRAEEAKDFEKLTENYKAGKLTPSERVIYEALASAKAEARIKENVAMVEKTVKESGIPEAYSEDLFVICAGRPEAEVKKLVEARKKLIAPLIADKGQGAGAGAGSKSPSKLQEKLAASGVSMKVQK